MSLPYSHCIELVSESVFLFLFLKTFRLSSVPWPHLLLDAHSGQVNLDLGKGNESPNITQQGGDRICIVWPHRLWVFVFFCCTTLLVLFWFITLCLSCSLKSFCNRPSHEFLSHFQMDGRTKWGSGYKNCFFCQFWWKRFVYIFSDSRVVVIPHSFFK